MVGLEGVQGGVVTQNEETPHFINSHLSFMTIIDFFGWGSFVLFATMYFPQIIKTMQTKDVSGVSIWTWIFSAVGLTMSVIYLLHYNPTNPPWPVISNQIFSAFLSVVQIGLFIRYKK